MSNARFAHIINLTEKEEQELKELQSKNIKIIEIFRAGVRVMVAKEANA